MPRNTLTLVANFSALLVALIALAGLIGYILNFSHLRYPAPGFSGLQNAVIYMGLLLLAGGLFLALRLYHGGHDKVRLKMVLRALPVTPLLVAGALLISTLLTLQASTQSNLPFLWNQLSVFYLFLLSVSLALLIFKRDNRLVLVYGVGVPALWVLNSSIFCLAGLTRHLLAIDNVSPIAPLDIAFMLASLTLLTGTIEQGGLLSPLASGNTRVRMMGIGALVAGYTILVFGIAMISATLQYYSARDTMRALHLLSTFEEGTILVSVLITLLGLRAAFFYSEAALYAQQQRELAERQRQYRHINEIIHGSIHLDQVFERITVTLQQLIQADLCLIGRYDAKKGIIFPPIRMARKHEPAATGMTPENNPVPELNSLAQTLAESGQSLSIGAPDLPVDTGMQNLLRQLELRTGLASPVRYDENMNAILLVGWKDPQCLDTRALDIIEHVTIQTAIGVHQAALFEEKAAAEKMLNQQLNFIRSLTESIGEGVIATDQEGRILFVNPAAGDMLGWASHGLETPFFFEAVQPEKLNIDMLREERNPKTVEDCFTRRDGSVFPVSCTCSAMQLHSMHSGMIFAFQDMTERKRAERALEQYAIRLEQSNHELEQFAYLASHDLQAPLIKLQKFSEILKKIEPLDLEGLDIVNRMQTSAQKMQTLIQDVLALARITTGALPFETVDLDRLAREVLDDYEETSRQLQASIEIDPLGTIEAEPVQIRQLLQNLIDNSLKFHRPGVPPEIRVRMSHPSPDICQIEVADNGIGFKEEYSERIFGMFERLNGLSQYEGNGIGLAICKKTVERHHGRITAHGKPDQGAVFLVTLPCRQTDNGFSNRKTIL